MSYCIECGTKLEYYDGMLGYESFQCPKCHWDINEIKIIKKTFPELYTVTRIDKAFHDAGMIFISDNLQACKNHIYDLEKHGYEEWIGVEELVNEVIADDQYKITKHVNVIMESYGT